MGAFVYKIYYWVCNAFLHLFYRYHVYNREKVPAGPCVICGNHSSMLDPIAIAAGMRNQHGINQPKFLAKSELERVPVVSQLLNFLLVYVRRGESDIVAVKKSIAHLRTEGKLVVFPEGTRVKTGESIDAKTGVIMMSMRSGSPLLPVYVTPTRKPMFGFKRIDVVFGEPYMPAKLPGESTSEAYHREANALMEKIHELGETLK